MENTNTPPPSGTPPGAASAGSEQTPARRFLVQFKMTACEEYTASTPAAALSDAENDDAPALGDFTGSEGPEIVAEWDPVEEDWKDTPPPPGTPPESVRDGLAELNRRLYALADLLDNGGREWREEIESVARLAKDVQTIAFNWKETPCATPAPKMMTYHDPAQLSTPYVVAPDLADVPLDALLQELRRRDMAGDCVAMVITPSDLSEYWECDDRGDTSPDSALPTLEEMRAIQKAFGRWQDNGGFTEVMEICRDAWNDAKEEGGSE